METRMSLEEEVIELVTRKTGKSKAELTKMGTI
jgi:hypothetical protein